MNINNIFAGILGFIMALALTYLTYPSISDWLDVIEPTELQVFLKVAYVGFLFIVCVIAPINLSTSDDTGEN
jgi:uncharacterized membrane protein required for colicin V production